MSISQLEERLRALGAETSVPAEVCARIDRTLAQLPSRRRRPITWRFAVAVAVVGLIALSMPMVTQAASGLIAGVAKIFGAKNDPVAVAMALENIRLEAPYLYELQTDQLRPSFARYYKDEDAGVTLYYQAASSGKLALEVREYPRAAESSMTGSVFNEGSHIKPLGPSRVFEAGNLTWSYYDKFENGQPDTRPVMRAEREGVFYEVTTYDLTLEEVASLLQFFQPSHR